MENMLLAYGVFHHSYYVITAVMIVAGSVAMFFAGEGLYKNGGILNNWVSTSLCLICGVTLLYYGMSSLLDFCHGNHNTLDVFINHVDEVAKFFW
jgi:hypothetical protein